ncbi:ER-golgi trafficking TRAPP I complex 85 kDa subunit-domain-containing protein [Pisolithus croceorrhizus]|nr:ER-golgi trafficking TRAPP I complex 85 kDa subunit-domain-containing protein [Pisolithus croceorrhizus]
MAFALPSSLSPHVCVLSSPDLEQLLRASSLPPLEDILQSFSPLPQVTTRTTNLVTVAHSTFAIRFSNLIDVENACLEDEEKRSARIIDWIGERIDRQCPKWVADLEKDSARDSERSPWWDELRRCLEGDNVPSKTEGWNHPVSIILAVSTTAPNPLQAVTTLHSRTLEFPSWVDTSHLVCTLIVHPSTSALSDEEAAALFNAVKKQYGVHVYLLPLILPSPPPPPVSIPHLLPQLPPPPLDVEQHDINGNLTSTLSNTRESLVARPNSLRISEGDIQRTVRFTREFVVMSLVPWMERRVIEWNEVYSSSRRLPSRLFSSTRRLFGSGISTPQTPVHTSSTSLSSLPARSHTYSASQTSLSGPSFSLPPPSQQRRLAEFATILGDHKLAIGVWESLQKEGKGGSDILPMLLSPSPATTLHVTQSLSAIFPSASELPAHAQFQALKYAVRWETSISHNDFLSDTLEGERWLVWAAGNSEETPTALLLAHAALLSARKQAKRRAALWYFFAASKLQKCGIKPLAMYLLRRAHEILSDRPRKLLSPSFWESQGTIASQNAGFNAALSGVEHPLGRLLYATGEIRGAIKLFLGLLRWSSTVSAREKTGDGDNEEFLDSDKSYLEDFTVAVSYLKSVSGQEVHLNDLIIPVKFAVPASGRLILRGDTVGGGVSEWERMEETWRSFWKPRGKETLEKSGKAVIGDSFWVEVVLYNPLDADVTLANLTLIVEAQGHDCDWLSRNVQVERIDEITLHAKENRPVSLAVRVSEASTLVITDFGYEFLGLLTAKESLARRGRRLQDTLQQRLTPTYAPDIFIKAAIEDDNLELDVSFATVEPLVFLEGEYRWVEMRLSNIGSRAIGEVWLLAGPEDQISPYCPSAEISRNLAGVLFTDNKLPRWTPYNIRLEEELQPSEVIRTTLIWRPVRSANQRICLMFVYREREGCTFYYTRVTKSYEINPCLIVSAKPYTTPLKHHPFQVNVEISNTGSTALRVTQLTTISPVWQCSPLHLLSSAPLQPAQSANFSLAAFPSEDKDCIGKTHDFVARTLGNVLSGREVESGNPPPLYLSCNHTFSGEDHLPLLNPAISHLYLCGRRNVIASSMARSHPHIPTASRSSIFPFYNPLSLDILVFWEIPSEQRCGFTLLSSLILGPSHGALQEIIGDAEQAKVKRSMYAETQREKTEMLQSIRNSEWNAESNPLVVSVEDGLVMEHDFDKGGCLAYVTFTLRNYSLTHPSRYILRFNPSLSRNAAVGPLNLLAPRYIGPLLVRGCLQPSESSSVEARLWVSRPGIYALCGWEVEVEVSEPWLDGSKTSWRTRHRYVQGSPAECCPYFTVNGLPRPHT